MVAVRNGGPSVLIFWWEYQVEEPSRPASPAWPSILCVRFLLGSSRCSSAPLGESISKQLSSDVLLVETNNLFIFITSHGGPGFQCELQPSGFLPHSRASDVRASLPGGERCRFTVRGGGLCRHCGVVC